MREGERAISAALIDGKAIAAELRADIARSVSEWCRAGHAPPALAVVLVGEDPASAVYVRNKIKATEAAGMRSLKRCLPADSTQQAVEAVVAELNADSSVHGILVQLPLPPGLDADAIIDRIDPDKDVDGLTVANLGRLMAARPGLVPCTPAGCLHLLDSVHAEGLSGKKAVIIGRSLLFGKPMGQLLLQRDCTLTMAHSKTRDLAVECRSADILIAAAGRPALVAGDWVKPGATVIDVGINRIPDPVNSEKTRLTGDVDFGAAASVAGAITPVPGGVGPMTIACLLRNTLSAARFQAQ